MNGPLTDSAAAEAPDRVTPLPNVTVPGPLALAQADVTVDPAGRPSSVT